MTATLKITTSLEIEAPEITLAALDFAKKIMPDATPLRVVGVQPTARLAIVLEETSEEVAVPTDGPGE